MADPTPITTIAPIASVETVQAVPVVEAVVAPIPTPEAPVASPEAPAPVVETLLADALDKNPVTPDPTKVEATTPEVKPAPQDTAETTQTTEPQSNQSEEPAPLPVYDAFTVPEGVTLDGERVSKFTEILSDLETKAKGIDHALVQEFGQKAVDFHVNEITKAVEDVNKHYETAWQKQKLDWKEEFLKDPDIGGNRFQTTVNAAQTFIRTHGGTADQQQEFRNLMETSGLGNHPAMIRLLANAGVAMSEGRPLAATRPAPQVKSKTATLYGGS